MKEIIIVGCFHEILELSQECQCKIIGFIDNNVKGYYHGYRVLGSDKDAFTIKNTYPSAFIVLSPDLPGLKKTLSEYYKSFGFSFANLISPNARISKTASIGKGVIIQSGVNVSSNTTIEDFVKLNFNVNVMHDSRIDMFTVVAPDVTILGRSIIGQCSYLSARTIVDHDVIVPSFTKTKLSEIINYEDF